MKYQITRSVPPTAAVVLATAPTDTLFLDSDVKAGSTYYYLVGAYNDAGTLGLRAGSAPVTATMSASGTTATTTSLAAVTNLHAGLDASNSSQMNVSWTYSPSDVRFQIDRGIIGTSDTSWTTLATWFSARS